MEWIKATIRLPKEEAEYHTRGIDGTWKGASTFFPEEENFGNYIAIQPKTSKNTHF